MVEMKYEVNKARALWQWQENFLHFIEYRVCLQKRKTLLQQLIIHKHEPDKLKEIQKEIRETLRKKKWMEHRHVHELRYTPHQVISSHLEYFNISLSFLSNHLKVESKIIQDYLASGTHNPGIENLIKWSMSNFRLDGYFFACMADEQ